MSATEVATPEEASETAAPARVLTSDQGFWTIAWRQFRKDRVAMTGLGICALLAGLAVFSPFLASGRPYGISGILTNFYSSDAAAFRDWHRRYQKDADALSDPSKLSPGELVDLQRLADQKRRGLPRILDRLGSYLRAEDASALRETARKYTALLATDPAGLDRDDHEALGREIDQKFCTLAFEPAYKVVSAPLADFAYGKDGAPALLKRAKDAAEDARNAREDADDKALAAARKKLAALAPELEATATQVEAGGRAMAVFLEPADRKTLEGVATELAGTIRRFSDPPGTKDEDDHLASRFDELSGRIDAFARKPISPDRQRLPRTTLHPVFDYLGPAEVAFVVLYATLALAVVLAGPFKAATAKLPLDPSDLGLIRLGLLLVPALLAALAWAVLVPDREPPSDSYYKAFAEELAEHPDGQSAISFAPIPFGENENIQPDRKAPPTWLEDETSLVVRLRTPADALPPGTTEDELSRYLDAPRGKTLEAEGWLWTAASEAALGLAPAKSNLERLGLVLAPDGTVTAVAPGSPAADEKLRTGDAIRRVGRTGVKSAAEVEAALDGLPLGKKKTVTKDGPRVELEARAFALEAWRAPTKPDAFAPWARALVAKRLTPLRYHWLGTDKGGRDVLARLVMGSRISLSVGFVSVGLNLVFAIVLGALAGYFRGKTDVVISRFTEILMCIPSFFLILTVRVIMPAWIPAIWAIMLTLGLIGWTGEMRLVRGEYLRLMGLDFVTAARALGLSSARVIFRHVLPNALAPVLVAATFGIAGAILTESALSFLGFGVQPPQASWGSVLNEAFGAEKEMWWVTVFPGFMIFLTITAYNLVGEGFRDATDPRLRK